MKNKKVIISLVGVLIMLLLIISATYAYFSVTITGNGSKTMITANTPKKHSLSVSTLYDDIHIHVDNEDMKLVNAGSYYGAVDKDNRYDKTKEEGTHNIIEVSSKGMENIRYSCSGDIKVTINIDDGSMGSVLEKEDVLLYLKGLGLDETLDLSTLKMNNTKIYTTTFEIDGDSSDYLRAIVELINKESYQNYIANKMLNVKIEAENMVCHENGTYKYLVKLNKSVKEIQNGKESSKTVSIFYDDEGMYQKIQNIYLVDYINTSNAIKTWELGDTSKGTKLDEVMGWLEETPGIEDSYDLYIGSEGPMRAPKNMNHAFTQFTNLKKIAGDALDTSEVTTMYGSFLGDTNLIDISALASWNTQNVSTMHDLFDSCRSLVDISALANWSNKKLTDMVDILYTTAINDLTPLKNWDVSKISNFDSLFANTSVSNLSPIKNWDVSHVTNMPSTFANTPISDLSPLANWDVSHVTNMGGMFYNTKISDITALSSWNITSVTNVSGMFQNTKVIDLNPISNWKISSVTNMTNMFNNTPISDLTPLSNWDVSSVTSMSGMFSTCTNLVDLNPITNWQLSSVINMNYMFSRTRINNLTPISGWDISHITEIVGLFSYTPVNDLTPLANWDIKNITNVSELFYDCEYLNDLSSLKDWQMSSMTNMYRMFAYTGITDLSPISNWNVSNVTNMKELFSGCENLINLNGLEKWQTKNVINMGGMFSWCDNLIDVNAITNWDVSNVTVMGASYSTGKGMFQGCINLTELNLSKWNVPNLIDISRMFADCRKLTELQLPSAPYNNIKDITKYGAIFGGNGAHWDGYPLTTSTVSTKITITVESQDQIEWVRTRLNEAIGEGNGTVLLKSQ